MRVCHLTSVHPRDDVRIFLKECTSLHRAGYDVALVVADGLGPAVYKGVRIVDAGAKGASRLRRMTLTQIKVLCSALRLKADVYHFHDAELIPSGLLLRVAGRKVIYDVHEDLGRSFVNRAWIPQWLSPLLAVVADMVESLVVRSFSFTIAATPTIQARFPERLSVAVRNWPMIEEFPALAGGRVRCLPQIVYVGAISRERGALAMVRAINSALLNRRVRLVLGGPIDDPNLERELKAADVSGLVEFRGRMNRREVCEAMACSNAGIVVLQPVKAYVDALPVKMFEYMAAALPVIASDFKLWREILRGGELGLLVNPSSPAAIAQAILWVIDHPTSAFEMGRRARDAVLNEYNWSAEERVLTEVYAKMASGA